MFNTREESIFVKGKMVRITWKYSPEEQEDQQTEYSVELRILNTDKNSLYLSFPEGEARDYPIANRTEVSLFITLDNDDVEEYSTVFEGIEDEIRTSPMWVVRFPYLRVSMTRQNTRQYYRLELIAPFFYCRINEQQSIPVAYPYQGEMADLSIGGLRGFFSVPLELGEILEIMLDMTPFRLILRGEVVIVKFLENPGKYVADVSVRFFPHEGEDHEEFLARYVMQEQIKRKLS